MNKQNMKHQRIQCSTAPRKHLRQTPTHNNNTFACTFHTVRQANICTAVTCTNEQEQNPPWFIMDLAAPRRPSQVPQTKYLQTRSIYLHIHLPFSVFESEVMQTCACASACVNFVRAACWDGELNSKCIWSAKHLRANTQNDTHTHTQACI